MAEMKSHGQEILITGMAGKFPKSSNVNVLRDNLNNKVDMVSEVDSRFSINHPSMPSRLGVCVDMEYFDAQFFAVNYRQASHLEAMTRKLLEVACEAIIDSGVNPRTLRNTNTGVFVGSCLMESEAKISLNKNQIDGYGLTGTARTMMANRISYWLGARGPSYTVFGECCSSAVALDHAFHALATGQCDSAVVGASNICLEPTVALQMQWLNFSTYGTKTKCFHQDADGSVRSDAVVAIFLQKAKDAKRTDIKLLAFLLRVYAQIVHTKAVHMGMEINNSQYRLPSGEKFGRFLKEFYTETDVRPENVEYVEAYGPAVKEADYEELQNIDDIFCSESRTVPLKVGCVKSNLGNCESTSTLVGLIKVCLAYNNGIMAGNLHLDKPRTDVAGVQDGRIELLDDNVTFRKGYAAVNSYSYVGICAHFLLKAFEFNKVMDTPEASMPYLVCASGRVEKSLENLFDDLENKPLDVGQIALLHNLYGSDIPGFVYRGYNILTTKMDTTVSISKKSDYYDGRQRPVWFVYSGMGSQWATMGSQLLRIPLFAAAIQRCHTILEPLGVDLTKIVTDPDPKTFDNIMNSFVGIAAIQIGLTDILTAIGIVPDNIIGHSVGELGCAYADGCLTAEEMILAAYYRGLVSVETLFIRGAMAAVGLGYNNAKHMCPPDIFIACHNGPESCTLSGPASSVRSFVDVLKSRGVFAKEVACSDIAYHSKYIAEAGPALQNYMSNVIKEPKSRSARWISSSIPQSEWDEPYSKLCSAEYLTNNLLNPVLFEEASRLIPDYAITIEIAPHGLLKAILKRSLPTNCFHISLTRRGHSDNTIFLLEAIGELSMHGLYPQLKNLYPSVQFPVPAETALLSHTTAWEHSEVWSLFAYEPRVYKEVGEREVILTKYDKHLEYLNGHVVNGVNTLPAAAQLLLVWETLGFTKGVSFTDLSVAFRNVRLESDVVIPDERCLELTIMLQKASGNFEITLHNATVASGQIIAIQNVVDQKRDKETVGATKLSSTDVYRLLALRGFRFSGDFRSIKQVDSNFTTAEVVWNNNWVTFLDGLMQLAILNQHVRGVSKPRFIGSLEIDIKKLKAAKGHYEKYCDVDVCYSKISGVLSCPGICMERLVIQNEPLLKQSMLNPKADSTIPAQLMNGDNVKLSIGVPGDFSTLSWVQTPVPMCAAAKIVQVHYARIGFSDLLVAQGKQNLLSDENAITDSFGMSYSGINVRGERVMGVLRGGALAGIVEADTQLTWPVPEHWSLQEAAAVPMAYVQAIYLLTERAEVTPGLSVLVTQGDGALGQAMISVCLSLDCRVFVCVRTASSKTLLLKLFPQLNDQDISVSRDSNVLESILKGTAGEGCDIVISSASGNERQILMQAVAPFGSFIDIGLQDMEENATFGLSYLWQGKNYKAVNFSSIFRDEHYGLRKILRNFMHKGICEGWVRPVTSVAYDPSDISRAFCVVSARRSTGAVVVKMRSTPTLGASINAVPHWKCVINHSYVVVCGQDGLGVELIDTLVRLGARNILLHTLDYDNGFLRTILRSYSKAKIILNTEDLKSETGCRNMLAAAENLGPIATTFVVRPNYATTDKTRISDDFVYRLDRVYRKYGSRELVILTPSLETGEPAQVNGGSALMSVCMDRMKNGYPAKIIHCKASHAYENIEPVEALTVAMNEIGQGLESAMLSNQIFINIHCEKNMFKLELKDIVDLLGINSPTTEDMEKPLSDLKTDLTLTKLLSIALKQYNNIYYTPEVLMKMSLKDITEDQSEQILLPEKTSNPFGLFFSFYDNDYERTTFEPLVWMKTLGYTVEEVNKNFECYDNKDYMIVLPGMDGLQLTMTQVCRRLRIRALLYQYTDLTEAETVGDMAQYILRDIKRRVGLGNRFYLLGYNFGALLALEMAALLEKEGNQGTVFCLDSSPISMKQMIKDQTNNLSTDEQQNLLLLHLCNLMLKNKPQDDLKQKLQNNNDWESKLECALQWLTYENCFYIEHTKTILNLALKRISQAKSFEVSFKKLKSNVVLIRGSNSFGLPDDYGLHQLSDDFVLCQLQGDHLTIPYNLRCSDIVNRKLNVV